MKGTVFLLFAFLLRSTVGQNNAFSDDINKCLFTAWTTAAGSANAVLSEPVKCGGKDLSGLCYGLNPPVAQFAVCYNKESRIPEFTGHIVQPNIPDGAGRDDWHNEAGQFAPKPQSSVGDYEKFAQRTLYPNFDDPKQQYLSRGHLTPNADYSIAGERELTMVNTNIAPQWQLFNSINWAALESAVRAYASAVNRGIYVFTGTGGKAKNIQNGNDIVLTNGVVTPRWYWKAVCDPGVGSIVFMGENSVGVTSDELVQGCNGQMQRKKNGVIYCYSLEGALQAHKAADFKLPPFNDKCKPSTKADFFNGRLNALQ